jgi:hypothetical protein
MANKKISELTETAQLQSGSYLPVAIGNNTYKVDYQYFINSFVNSTVYNNKIADLEGIDQGLQAQIDNINTSLTATYLAAYSNTAQQATGNPQAMNLGTVDFSQNLSLQAGTKIVIVDTGIYNLQFSAQYGGNYGQVVAAWNFLINAISGEQYELYWKCTNTQVWLITYPTVDPIPATPSVITTVTKIN